MSTVTLNSLNFKLGKTTKLSRFFPCYRTKKWQGGGAKKNKLCNWVYHFMWTQPDWNRKTSRTNGSMNIAFCFDVCFAVPSWIHGLFHTWWFPKIVDSNGKSHEWMIYGYLGCTLKHCWQKTPHLWPSQCFHGCLPNLCATEFCVTG